MSNLRRRNDRQTNVNEKDMATEFLKSLLSAIFIAIEVMLSVLIISIVYSVIKLLNNGIDLSKGVVSFIALGTAILCILFGVFCHKARKYIDNESDRQYIVNYFAAIVALVALIVSLIGLIKDVSP